MNELLENQFGIRKRTGGLGDSPLKIEMNCVYDVASKI